MSQDAPTHISGRKPLQAHSLAEVHLYLMVTSCDHCREGPLRGATSLRETTQGRSLVTIQAKCSSCNEESWYLFEIPEPREQEPVRGKSPRRINPTDEPSEILDVAQWVTLHQIILRAAERTGDKSEARELRCEAAECLDEALRFYAPDSDLPPAGAFFSARSRQRLKDRPELYIRQALIAKRQVLPTRGGAARDTERGEAATRKRWWRFRR